jgi:hypothetical protein
MGEAHRKKTARVKQMPKAETMAMAEQMFKGEVNTIRLELPMSLKDNKAALQDLTIAATKAAGQTEVAFAITFSSDPCVGVTIDETRLGISQEDYVTKFLMAVRETNFGKNAVRHTDA